MNPHHARVPTVLFIAGLACTVVAATADLVMAQEPGQIVEIEWGGQPTKAKIEHCMEEKNACYLYVWDAESEHWSKGTVFMQMREIRGLND